MRPAAWQYYKSPRHPRDGLRAKQWDLLRPVGYRYDRYRHQTQSPLFQLPPELRALIFRYALSDCTTHDTLSARINAGSHSSDYLHRFKFAETNYHAPIDAALLRTCQRVYQEAWWVPLATSNLLINESFTHSLERFLGETLEIYHRRHCLRLQSKRIEIDHVKVVGPPYLRGILTVANIPKFYPRCITLTVSKDSLGHWIVRTPQHVLHNTSWLPPSVRELHFELEAPDQMRGELILLANLLRATWAFDRVDGVRLAVNPEQQLQVYRITECDPICYRRRNTPSRIGVMIPFRPLDRGDARCAIPMEMPSLSSRGMPLIYGYPESCLGACPPPLSNVEFALHLAKHPFVSRSWIPPPLLPDRTRFQHRAECGVKFLCKERCRPAPANPSNADPTPATQTATVAPPDNEPSTTSHAINAAPTTSAASGPSPSHYGGALAYGTNPSPAQLSAVTAPRRWKKVEIAWWHQVLCYFLVSFIIALIICAST